VKQTAPMVSLQQMMQLRETIPFALGSSVPEVADDVLVAAAQRCAGTLVVTGHSCWLGTTRVQQAVGLARAQAVRARLVAAGVDPARIRVASAGAREPVAPNTTRAGQRKNRRATLTCTTFGGEP
jgi:outer membrane protein OmpA-like peptidoglycan-associated protein